MIQIAFPVASALTHYAASSAVQSLQIWTSYPMLLMYLVMGLIGGVIYYQYKWNKDCRENVQVAVVRSDGRADIELAPKSGGSVALKNPHTGTVRLWPINKLSTIDVLYPGVGFVPKFMQKEIRMVIVDEDDWEPLLNRGAHRDHIASPDVIAFMQKIAVQLRDPEDGNREEMTPDEVLDYIDSLSTAPTRDMIASPAVLGNLIHEKITEAVITVNKEMLDSISSLMRRLGRMVSPTMYLLGTGALAVLLIVTIVVASNAGSKASRTYEELQRVESALGIQPVVTPK